MWEKFKAWFFGLPMPRRPESVLLAVAVLFIYSLAHTLVPGLAAVMGFVLIVWLLSILFDSLWSK